LLLDFWNDKARKKRGSTPEIRAIYDELQAEAVITFSTIADRVAQDEISPDAFERNMREEIRKYYLSIALVAKQGDDLTDRDREDLELYLAETYTYLSGFKSDVEMNRAAMLAGEPAIYTPARTQWRASRYAFSWDKFSRFTLPAELWDILPAHPGIDCEGGPACGCFLEWYASSDGEMLNVHWYLDPVKDSCILCTGFAVDWQPLEIPIIEFLDVDDIEDVDWDELENILEF
jgi:hypothetical protein